MPFVTKKSWLLLCSLLLLPFFCCAQLIINEVSQGTSGTEEYVEFVVVGTPSCTTVPCFDLRGYIIDDNNGTFGTAGIAKGCMRFTTNAIWACIPAGTIIVIYDNTPDPNPNIPATDLSMSDGNCRLIIPGNNTTLLERNTTSPSTCPTYPCANTTYTTTGFGTSSNWAGVVAMANGADSFQSRDPLGNLLSVVSWGTDTLSNIIYFSGSMGGKVISNLNTVDTNPNNQANWAVAAVAGNETPGVANNVANAAWLSSMNFSCGSVIPTALTTTVSVTNASCGCTGSATVTASGAVGPYTYSWTPIGGSAATATNLCVGNYTVTVSSANGCVQTNTLTIASVPTVTASVTSTSITCNGLANGSATTTVSGVVGPFTYTWSPSGGNDVSATGLSAGHYTVSVTDGNGCIASDTTTIYEPTAVTVTTIVTNVSCNGGSDGSATVTASGGTNSYTYTWTPTGSGPISTGLTANAYTVVVNDVNHCAATSQFTVTQHSAVTLSVTSTPAKCGLNNGTATAIASGGAGTLTYTWSSGGGGASTATGLSSGVYSVTVTDSLGCSLTKSITVGNHSLPVISTTHTDVACNGATTGSASVTIVSGGTAPFTYAWSGGTINDSIATGLSAGNYTVTVTDSATCNATATFTVTQPNALTLTLSSTPATCNLSNGTATGTVNGGTLPYNSYTWASSGGSSLSATGLAPANYTLTVLDADLCSISNTITVGNKPAPKIKIIDSTNVSCYNGTNGSATASVTIGTAPYIYLWSGGTANDSIATGLSAGNYTVSVTDSTNCSATASVIITQPTAITTATTSTPAACVHANGTATVSVSGGVKTYTYNWSNSAGTDSIATNLSGNTTYTVLVTDANSCTVTTSVFVSQTSSIILPALTYTNVTCNGLNDGAISSNASGGTGTLNYTWAPSGAITSSINGLSPNTYTLFVIDGVGCKDSASVTITEPSVLIVTVPSVAICNGQTATITATPSGGNGVPYIYNWSTGSTYDTTIVKPTATSTYTLASVQDSKGCATTLPTTVVVTVSPSLSITISANDSICNGKQATLTAHASGGNGGPYIINWQPGNINDTSLTVSPNTQTTYTATASDGCSLSVDSTVVVYVTKNTPSITTNTNVGCAPLSINFTGSSTANDVTSINWNFGDGGTSSLNNITHYYNAPGKYTITLVTHTSKMCVDSLVEINLITVYHNPVANFSASRFETDIFNSTISFYDQSSTSVNTWHWFFDTASATIKNPTHLFPNEGTYPVMLAVIDTLGCKDTIIQDVIIKPIYSFYAPNGFTPNADGRNETFLPTGSGWDDSTFNLWVFDRWGNQIFYSNTVTQGWNGTKHNERLQEDVYVWKANVFDLLGRPHEYSGQITLIR